LLAEYCYIIKARKDTNTQPCHGSCGSLPPSLSAAARIQFQATLYGVCSGRSDTWTGCSPSTRVFPCRYHSTDMPYSCMSYATDAVWS